MHTFTLSAGHSLTIAMALGESTVVWPTILMLWIWLLCIHTPESRLIRWACSFILGLSFMVAGKIAYEAGHPEIRPFSPSGHAFDTVVATGLLLSTILIPISLLKRAIIVLTMMAVTGVLMGMCLIHHHDHTAVEIMLGNGIGFLTVLLSGALTLPPKHITERQGLVLATFIALTIGGLTTWVASGHFIQTETVIHHQVDNIEKFQHHTPLTPTHVVQANHILSNVTQ
jgi:hypothetical protein